MNVFKVLCLLFCCIITISCVKYDAEPSTGKTLPRTCGYSAGVANDWTYSNLRTGERSNTPSPNQDIIKGEQRERINWGLAFCGYRLRTNSGTSGIGQGAATDLGCGSHDKRKTALQSLTDLKWTVDSDTEVYVAMLQNDWNKYLIEHGLDSNENPWFDPSTDPAKILTSANPILVEAMSFASPPPVYTPSYYTYVTRIADSKRYFKIQIISWYNVDSEIGDSGGQISYYCDELN